MTIESLQTRIKELGDNASLDEAVRKSAIDMLTRAVERLQAGKQAQDRLTELSQAAESRVVDLQTVREQIQSIPAEAPPPPDARASLEELTRDLKKHEAELEDAKKSLAEWTERQKRRSERRVVSPQELATKTRELEELQAKMRTPPAADQPADLREAQQALNRARLQALQAEIALLRREVPLYNDLSELLTARIDLYTRRVTRLEKQVKAYQEVVSTKRKEEAERQAEQTREATAEIHPRLRDPAKENEKLATERTEITDKLEDARESLDAITSKLERVTAEYKDLEARDEAAGGFAESFGIVLREKRQRYRRPQRFESHAREIGEAQVRKLDLEARRQELADPAARAAALTEGLAHRSDAAREQFQAEAERVFRTQRELVDALIVDYEAYINALSNLEVSENALRTETQRLIEFIDERVLWIRSAPVISPSDLELDLRTVASTATQLFRPPAPGRDSVAVRAREILVARPLAPIGLATVWVAWMLFGVHLRRRLETLGQKAAHIRTDTFSHTIKASIITVVLALRWPAACAGAAWFCGLLVDPYADWGLAKALASGLWTAAAVTLVLEGLREICRPGGIGVAHFRWDPSTTRRLRRGASALLVTLLPAIFLAEALREKSLQLRYETAGRWFFIFAFASLTAFLVVLLHPERGILRGFVKRDETGWLFRLRWAWYLLAVAVPFALVIMSAAGYYYTSLELSESALETVWFLLALLLVQSILLRWSLVHRRRLAIEQALERKAAREQEQEQPRTPSKGGSMSGVSPPPSDEAEVDLEQVNEQTTRLLRTIVAITFLFGAYFIWEDVLPALGILETVSIGWTKDAEGKVPVTLADLVVACVAGLITYAAARNLPGFLELAIFQRLPLDHGSRYALRAISSYLVILIGIIVTFQTIGVGWSRVQWLAAALTVGLGFGLQEIFANFVSGLILLFERPIRVGDTVSVGTVSGTVTQIRFRATVITDWDRKELVVPNREFITGQVVNWTLTDPVVRIISRVGVAYGSDLQKVFEVLQSTVRSCPGVLDDPYPRVHFMEFGDSSLNFEIRYFVRSVEDLLHVRSRLLTRIDAGCREAGIEIAFPQRDLHIRSVTPEFHPPAPTPQPQPQAPPERSPEA